MSKSSVLTLTIFILSSTLLCAESYRILTIFPFNGKSHNVMFSALIRGLANRGHQIDDITHLPLKNPPPSYKVKVDLNGSLENPVNSFTIDFAKELGNDIVNIVAKTYGNRLCHLMGLEEMQIFIKDLPKSPPYDLVITEAFGSNCYMGFGHLLKVPVVGLASAIEYPWMNNFIGNNDNLAVVRNGLIGDFNRSRFWDRLKNVFTHYWSTYEFHVATNDVQTELMRKYLSPDMPNIREVEKSVALTLVNSHPVLFGSRPVAPSLVEVAGLHVGQENMTLPSKLKKWLDESKSGFVYFTLGSLVIIETLPVDTIQDIYQCFRDIAPIRVVMKIVNPRNLPPGLPDNVFTSSWLPQQPILAHPNILAFITHGGLMGSQEALYYGVPLIGIPLFGDQARNIATFVEKNMAIKIELNSLNFESLSSALSQILNNPKYRKNVKLYSKLFKDRPANAMDTSIFWIEYVIRNGPDVLKSPALELSWWQLLLLDVFCFILISCMIVLFFVYYFIKLFFKKLFIFKKVKQA